MRYKVLKIVTVFCALLGFLPISLSTIKGKICIRRSRIWQTYQYFFVLFYFAFAFDLALKGVESFQYSTDTWMVMLVDAIYCVILPGILISLHIHRSSILKVLEKTVDISSELPQKFWMKTAWSLLTLCALFLLLSLVTFISSFAHFKEQYFVIIVLLRRKIPFTVVTLSIATIFTLFATVLSILSCHWNQQNAVLLRNTCLLKTQLGRFREVTNLCQTFGRNYGFINLLLVMLMFTEFVFYFYYIWAMPCHPPCPVFYEWVMSASWLSCIGYLVMQKVKATTDVVYESKRTCQILTQNDSLMDYEQKAEEFTMDCLHNPVTFSCCGLFELNFSLLGKILSAIATYTLIMIQFR